jgi:hypothetical protein
VDAATDDAARHDDDRLGFGFLLPVTRRSLLGESRTKSEGGHAAAATVPLKSRMRWSYRGHRRTTPSSSRFSTVSIFMAIPSVIDGQHNGMRMAGCDLEHRLRS